MGNDRYYNKLENLGVISSHKIMLQDKMLPEPDC